MYKVRNDDRGEVYEATPPLVLRDAISHILTCPRQLLVKYAVGTYNARYNTSKLRLESVLEK